MLELDNEFLSVQIHPEDGSYSIQFPEKDSFTIHNARIQATYSQYGKTYRVNPDDGLAVKPVERSELDARTTAAIQVGYDPRGIQLTAIFSLQPGDPFLRIGLQFENRGASPVELLSLEPFLAGARAVHSYRPSDIEIQPAGSLLNWFSNSWQSWPQSRTYLPGQKPLKTGIGYFQGPDWFNPSTPRTTRIGHYSGDFFGILAHPSSRTALLAGFLSQKEQYGTLECWTEGLPSLSVRANGDSARIDPGITFISDPFILSLLDLDHPDPLGGYLDAVAAENKVHLKPQIPTGWCSWYQFYTKISEPVIASNVNALKSLQNDLPISLIQIDDGFESQIGDWLSFSPGFPNGIASLAKEIQDAGTTPGLWLAPFIVHPKAKILKEHPEYILRDARGKPVNSGFNWNTFTTALDLTCPGALEAACQVISTAVHEWGFPYLKLDFLFAGARPGIHADPTLTRAQILRRGMAALRQAAGTETYLLGCGAPLGSALGLVDAMRIGADVSSDWAPKYHGLEYLFPNEPHLPSVRNALQNTVVRAPMHRRWWINDPDCLLIRPETHLTQAELQTHASLVALTGGSLIFSDDFLHLPPERIRLAKTLLPPIGERAQVMGLFDESSPHQLRVDLDNGTGPWTLVGLVNWEEKPSDLVFSPVRFGFPLPCYARLWWEDRLLLIQEDPYIFSRVPPHGCILLAIRPVASEQPLYLGSSLHISQGLEVKSFATTSRTLSVQFELPRTAEGVVDLYLPDPVQSATLDGQPIPFSLLKEKVYRFAVHFDQTSHLELTFGKESA